MQPLLKELFIALTLLQTTLAAQVPVSEVNIPTNEVVEVVANVSSTVPLWKKDRESPPSREEVKNIIVEEAGKYKVDVGFALYLARWESDFNPLAKNPKSSARGVYQWLIGSWETMCEGERTEARDNTRCAMKTISEGGVGHWCADSNMKQRLNKEYPGTCQS